ncbi:MAG: flagellar hook-basal body complex protein [Anaeromyxobacter sp.]|nr:flagellar hook-basal body complex protein [Anaeromyxobacter sp.]
MARPVLHAGQGVDMTLAAKRRAGAVSPGFLLATALAAGCGGLGEGEASCLPIAGPEVLRQGELVPTGLAHDLSLRGAGFFALSDDRAPFTAASYTRAGRFTVDRDGFLVDLQERRVLGWQADPSGTLAAAPGPRSAALPAPRATTFLFLTGNLQADAAVLGAFDPANPGTTSSFSTSMTVYDTLGGHQPVQVFFTRTGSAATGTAWTWSALADGGGLQGGSAGTLQVVAGGDLTFDAAGRLASDAPLAGNATSFHPLGAGAPQPLTFNFGDPTGELGSGLLGLTQFASPSATTFSGQDGFGAGQLASVRIDPDGRVDGDFTNGRSRVLAQVGVAVFPAPAFLAPLPGHRFAPTVASGAPALGAPCAGLQACVVSGALERLGEESSTCVTPGR